MNLHIVSDAGSPVPFDKNPAACSLHPLHDNRHEPCRCDGEHLCRAIRSVRKHLKTNTTVTQLLSEIYQALPLEAPARAENSSLIVESDDIEEHLRNTCGLDKYQGISF
jgi:hypothetical protein